MSNSQFRPFFYPLTDNSSVTSPLIVFPPFLLPFQGGLFQSPHTDENDVQTISHGCNVLPLKEFSKRRKQQQQQQQQPGDTYYLAGSYDPTMMTVSFQQGVLKQ